MKVPRVGAKDRKQYNKVMKWYGVERPPPPISWNDRQRMIEQEQAEQPDAEQSALFALDDPRKAA